MPIEPVKDYGISLRERERILEALSVAGVDVTDWGHRDIVALIRDIVQSAVRAQVVPPDEADKFFEYAIFRLFPEDGRVDLPSRDAIAMAEAIWGQPDMARRFEEFLTERENVIFSDPSTPFHADRLLAVLTTLQEGGDIPADLGAVNLAYLDQLERIWLPEIEKQVVESLDGSFTNFTRDHEVQASTPEQRKDRISTTYGDWLNATEPGGAIQREMERLIGEGRYKDAYELALRQISVDPTSIHMDVFEGDLDAARAVMRGLNASPSRAAENLIASVFSVGERDLQARQADEAEDQEEAFQKLRTEALKKYDTVATNLARAARLRGDKEFDKEYAEDFFAEMKDLYTDPSALPPDPSAFMHIYHEEVRKKDLEDFGEEEIARLQDQVREFTDFPGARVTVRQLAEAQSPPISLTDEQVEIGARSLVQYAQNFRPRLGERPLTVEEIIGDQIRELAEGTRGEAAIAFNEDVREQRRFIAEQQQFIAEQQQFEADLESRFGPLPPSPTQEDLDSFRTRLSEPTLPEPTLPGAPPQGIDDIQLDEAEPPIQPPSLPSLPSLPFSNLPVFREPEIPPAVREGVFAELIALGATGLEGQDPGFSSFLFDRTPTLREQFSQALLRPIDPDEFRTRFDDLQALQDQIGLPTSRLREIAVEESRRPAPSPQEFFQSQLGGLREEFRGSPLAQIGRQRADERASAEAERSRLQADRDAQVAQLEAKRDTAERERQVATTERDRRRKLRGRGMNVFERLRR